MAAAVAVTCLGLSTTAQAIMRRHDVADDEYIVAAEDFPAVVDLLEPGDCLATLVAPAWLLTAAHCAEVLQLPHTIRIGGRDHDVEGVVCERGYDGQINDIALVHISPPVSDVISIPLYRDADEVGQTVTFVGRGDSGTGLDGQRAAVNDGRTRRATNRIEETSKRWLEILFDSPGTAGATELEGISGDGDSGGPAFVGTGDGLRLVGVSSWQAGSEKKIGLYGAREFYTRVSRHTDFVDETTGPDWDGRYRRCTSGCAVDPSIPGGSTGTVLVALAGLLWGRRRRARIQASAPRP